MNQTNVIPETTKTRLDYRIEYTQKYAKGNYAHEFTAKIVEIVNIFSGLSPGELKRSDYAEVYRSSKLDGKERQESKKFETYDQASKWAVSRIETIKEEEIEKLELAKKLAAIKAAAQAQPSTPTPTP